MAERARLTERRFCWVDGLIILGLHWLVLIVFVDTTVSR